MTSWPRLSLLILTSFLVADGVAQPDEPILTTSAEIRALSPQDAQRSKAVRIRGVVTFVASNGAVFFVQDETGGVCVSGPRDKPLKGELKQGAVVEVEGVTAPGRIVPHVTARKREQMRVSVVGEAPLPEPREVTVAQLQRPEFQGLRVEVSGVIRAVESRPFGPNVAEMLELTLADQRDRLVVAWLGWRSPNGRPMRLVGASVKVRGVFNATAFERQPLLANRLFIAAMRELQVIEPAGQPFAEPIESIEATRDAADDPGQPDRVRVRGTVTVAAPGKGMYVEDETAAIFVEASSTSATGQQIEAAGFPAKRDGSPVLEDAVWRTATFAGRVNPPFVTAEAALNPALDGRLVQIEALLLTTSSAGEGPTLILQGGDRVFLAKFANPRLKLPSLRENSWLRVTGVCVNATAPQLRSSAPDAATSFHLLMSGPQSVEIAHAPSWWTLRRFVAVAGTMAVLALSAGVWATTLRRRVAKQTAQIREHLAREAVAQERFRIAGELHDSVQQDLLGITMQLKATDRLLESAPDRARAALTVASAMVRHSQAETHRAVWDLHESAQEQADVVTSIDHMLARLGTDDSIKVSLNSDGETQPLPQAFERQVLRITQEAVCNALKHAEPTRIDVELKFAPGRLSLCIRDNGKGFDADRPPSAAGGHFGLFGMQERAVKMNADLRVTSRLGSGTSVELDVPLPPVGEKSEPARASTTLPPLLPRTSSS
jgi:signal transduction histidine kinase